MTNHISTTTVNRILFNPSSQPIRYGDVFFAVTCSLLLTWWAFSLTPISASNPVASYKQYAENPFRFLEFPYGARMATPVLVGIFWNDLDAGFRSVAFASFFLCGVFLILWLRTLGTRLRWAASLLPAFVFASTPLFLIANPWYVDPMSYALLTVTFAGMLSGNFGLTMAALAFGALNRPESISVAAVLAIAWWRRDRPFASLAKTALCATPAILFILAMRYLWPLVSDYQVWKQICSARLVNNPVPYSTIFAQQGIKELIDPVVYRETLPPLWGLALIGFFKTSLRVRAVAIAQIALSILPMIVATDYFRLPFYVFPAVILLSGIGIQALANIHTTLAGFAVASIWILTAFAPKSIVAGIVLAAALIALHRFYDKTPNATINLT